MAGHRRHGERDAGRLDLLPTGEQHVWRARAHRDPRRRERVGLLQQHALAGGRVDRRTGHLGEVGEADDVIEVAVRDEDRGAGCPERSQAKLDRLGVAARVDHDRFRRSLGSPDEIGVRPDRRELELFDGERHGCRV